MYCKQCRKTKLRREFPSKTLTAKCNHAPLHCLRCVTHFVKNASRCSQCSEQVNTNNPTYCEFMETLERLFPETPHSVTETAEDASKDINQTISVVMLGGQSTVIEYRPDKTVASVKKMVEQRLGPSPDKQRLLYKDKELMTYTPDKKLAELQDYSVQPFSTLHLIVLLYAIPDSFDHVIFDLFWGYPNEKCDFLDASVLIYSGECFQKEVDYHPARQHFADSAVYHSGDVMDHEKRLGHHTINVKLKNLPEKIDKLFFTLSAWNSPNISKYKNPSMRFFEAKERTKQLCSDKMDHAAHSQAIIMCGLCKINEGWKVFSLRTLSAGNAKDYSPLKQTINELIAKNMC